MTAFRASKCHVDVDKYLNRVVPPSQLYLVPRPISRWFGYRDGEVKEEVGNLVIAFWAFVGTFCGLGVVAAIFKYSPAIRTLDSPILFASFGATAILEYNTIHSPLAQPRNSLLGHTISSVIGVSIAKLFMRSSNYEEVKWIAAAAACGLSSAVMTITNTIHPPGGATAVLAAIDPGVQALGWHFIPLILLGSMMMLLVGLVTNNVQRRFPLYWWTAVDLRPQGHTSDLEKASRSHDSPASIADDDKSRKQSISDSSQLSVHQTSGICEG